MLTHSQQRRSSARVLALTTIMALIAGLFVSAPPPRIAWAAQCPPPNLDLGECDTIADPIDGVAGTFGQLALTNNEASNNGGSPSALGLFSPTAVAVFSPTTAVSPTVAVADRDNNRVLVYSYNPITPTFSFTTSIVLGQSSFTQTLATTTGAASLTRPSGVAFDTLGNLYVADTSNNRVVRYTAPFTNGQSAAIILGQATTTDFSASVGAQRMNRPTSVAVDTLGNLYVADSGNNRVLRFNGPTIINNDAADVVIGQANLTSSAPNQPAATPTASNLNDPLGVAVDTQNRLYVADTGNNRVLRFNTVSNSAAASFVLGQPDFVSNLANRGTGTAANTLSSPRSVAIDSLSNVYVADTGNNRVLVYRAPLTNGQAADTRFVFGQTSATAALADDGASSASTLHAPNGLAISGAINGNRDLFVADTSNNRVLFYNTPIPNQKPTITLLSPDNTDVNVPVVMNIDGTGFTPGSTVQFGPTPAGILTPTTISPDGTNLTVSIPASLLTNEGKVTVTVTITPPVLLANDLTSDPKDFTIFNPAPTITSSDPVTRTIRPGGFTLNITGTNFFTDSLLIWDVGGTFSTTLPINFVSSTNINRFIDEALIPTTPRNVRFLVINPSPSRGPSNEATVQILNPAPVLIQLRPNQAAAPPAGRPEVARNIDVVVDGANFVNGVKLFWNGSERPTVFGSSTLVTMTVLASDLNVTFPTGADFITASVTAENPAPSPGRSNSLPFTVAKSTLPNILGLNPPQAIAGGPSFLLTVTGDNFNASSKVFWNGLQRITLEFDPVRPRELIAVISADDIRATGVNTVTVVNTTQNPGTSAAAEFLVVNPEPTVFEIDPRSTTVGSPNTALRVRGTGFVTSSVVRLNSTNLTTAFINSSELSATVPASELTTARAFNIIVANPQPRNDISLSQDVITFTVTPQNTNPVPSLSAITPTTATVGSGPLTLVISGSNFISSTEVRWGNPPVTLTKSDVTSTTIQAQVPASLLSTAGVINVSAFNPTPGGGTSGVLTFTIIAANVNPAPTLESITPVSTTVGTTPLTLTLNGTGFISGSQVRFGSQVLTPTSFTTSTLQVAVPVNLVSTSGVVTVTVFNPQPGGGESAPRQFAVTGVQLPAPTLTALSPSSAAIGGGAVTLTISGTNFANGSQVRFGTTVLTPTTVASTTLQVSVPASALTATGTVSVTVFGTNGESNVLPFTVGSTSNPVINTLSPGFATVNQALTLTINGNDFDGTAQIELGGQTFTPSTRTNTQLIVSLPASAVSRLGPNNLVVVNGNGRRSNTAFLNVCGARGCLFLSSVLR